ncbi:hypothetical protein D3C76_1769300 [compost metagenome]
MLQLFATANDDRNTFTGQDCVGGIVTDDIVSFSLVPKVLNLLERRLDLFELGGGARHVLILWV